MAKPTPSRSGSEVAPRRTFSALYYHFGKYGRQEVHVHQCHEDHDLALIGDGRKCSGDKADHHRERYDDDRGWVRVRA